MSYPWGKSNPRRQLKQTREHVRRALDAANEPGYVDIGERLESVVQSAKPLKVVLQYLSRSGLRSNTGKGVQTEPVSSRELQQALQAIDAPVLRLAQASIRSVSEDYENFVVATNDLVGLAERAIEQGVEDRPADDAGTAWKRFGA